jgi:hypothetical protein
MANCMGSLPGHFPNYPSTLANVSPVIFLEAFVLSIVSGLKSSGRWMGLGALAVALAAPLLWACDSSTETRQAPPTPSPSPTIHQADWQIKSYPAVTFRRVSKKERHRFRVQRPRVKTLIKDVYDALFLEPKNKKEALKRNFTRRARRAFARTRAGIEAGAAVKITRRSAKVGIQAKGARRAVAVVTVRAKAMLEDRAVRVVHKSKLWLERSHRGWRVIGFEVNQQIPPTRDKGDR